MTGDHRHNADPSVNVTRIVSEWVSPLSRVETMVGRRGAAKFVVGFPRAIASMLRGRYIHVLITRV
jgi:hypothetical protein